jgi:hypothetical protein
MFHDGKFEDIPQSENQSALRDEAVSSHDVTYFYAC